MKITLIRTVVLVIGTSLLMACMKTEQTGQIHKLEKLYASCTIDGKLVELQENKDGIVNGYGKGGIWVEGMQQYFERQSTKFAKNGEDILSIYFMQWLGHVPPTQEEIKSIFYEGHYTYGSSDFLNLIAGVEIHYIDENGIVWTTRGDQTGSYFEITTHERNTTDSYTPYMTTGRFSCKLYNAQGQCKTITDGRFKGRTVVYY